MPDKPEHPEESHTNTGRACKPTGKRESQGSCWVWFLFSMVLRKS